MKLDTQQIERLGLAILKSSLISANFEVATPERDNGIDLIMYRWGRSLGFRSAPIQMKSASTQSFSIDRGYECIPNLYMAYVWNTITVSAAVIYVMPYREAVSVGDVMGWTKTTSWIRDGEYSTTAPSKKLVQLLEKFRVSTGYYETLPLSDASNIK